MKHLLTVLLALFSFSCFAQIKTVSFNSEKLKEKRDIISHYLLPMKKTKPNNTHYWFY